MEGGLGTNAAPDEAGKGKAEEDEDSTGARVAAATAYTPVHEVTP